MIQPDVPAPDNIDADIQKQIDVIESSQEPHTGKLPFASVLSVAFSPDGKYLASKSLIKLRIWSTDSWNSFKNISLRLLRKQRR